MVRGPAGGPEGMIVNSHFVAALLAVLAFIAQPVEASPLVAGADHSKEDHSGEDHSGEALTAITISEADFSSADLSGTVLVSRGRWPIWRNSKTSPRKGRISVLPTSQKLISKVRTSATRS
jgi:hypothetical protein